MEDDSKLTVIQKQMGNERIMTHITGEKQSPDYHTALLGKSVQTQPGAENAAAISSELYTPEPIIE